ncbi:MAG: hypothetical protein GDA51_01815 [Ekhidna sp.]|nr:hypothetical protein [Ekhidna sp.]
MGYDVERSEVVLEVSGGRTCSLRQLSAAEYAHLLQRLRHFLPRGRDEVSENNMRRKVIALFRKMGYEQAVIDEKGRMQFAADMPAIEAWVKKYGKFHKSLNRHTKKELAQLVSQVELMNKKDMKAIHRV